MAYRTWHSLYVYDENMKYLEVESNEFEVKIYFLLHLKIDCIQ